MTSIHSLSGQTELLRSALVIRWNLGWLRSWARQRFLYFEEFESFRRNLAKKADFEAASRLLSIG